MRYVKLFEQFVGEASKRDPESIRREYKELKKMSTAELRKMWSLSSKIGNPKELDKEGLISDILHNKHGRKYVTAAFEQFVSESGNAISQSRPFEQHEVAAVGGLENIVPTEGITFVYKGKVYKYTGIFAPIHQIRSILAYKK